MKRVATQAKDFSRGAERVVTPTSADLRATAAKRAGALDAAALMTITQFLSGGDQGAGETLRAIELAERYEQAAAKLRKWSGRFS